MSRAIGLLGVVGILVALGGIGVVGYVDPLLAGGLLAVLVGIGLVVVDVLRRLLSKLGLGAMM